MAHTEQTKDPESIVIAAMSTEEPRDLADIIARTEKEGLDRFTTVNIMQNLNFSGDIQPDPYSQKGWVLC